VLLPHESSRLPVLSDDGTGSVALLCYLLILRHQRRTAARAWGVLAPRLVRDRIHWAMIDNMSRRLTEESTQTWRSDAAGRANHRGPRSDALSGQHAESAPLSYPAIRSFSRCR
jgi:hypothetical protein